MHILGVIGGRQTHHVLATVEHLELLLLDCVDVLSVQIRSSTSTLRVVCPVLAKRRFMDTYFYEGKTQ
jgi:hypothetical protein